MLCGRRRIYPIPFPVNKVTGPTSAVIRTRYPLKFPARVYRGSRGCSFGAIAFDGLSYRLRFWILGGCFLSVGDLAGGAVFSGHSRGYA